MQTVNLLNLLFLECMCPCTRMKNLVIIENEAELLTKIDNIKKELAVKKSLLSSSIRKRTSAVDPRPSASIVGGTISVVIIATVVGLIVLSDLTRLINFCWKIISKRWNRKTRAAQKEKVQKKFVLFSMQIFQTCFIWGQIYCYSLKRFISL